MTVQEIQKWAASQGKIVDKHAVVKNHMQYIFIKYASGNTLSHLRIYQRGSKVRINGNVVHEGPLPGIDE